MAMGSDALRHNLTNPAKSFLYDIVFTSPIGGGDAEAMQVRCISTSIPGRSVGSIKIPFKGTPGVKYPGKLSMSQTWNCSFAEGTDKKIFDALYGWQQVIRDVESGIGAPDSEIKSDIILILTDQAGAAWLKIKLVGAYVESIPENSISWDSESSVTFNATFSYDYWVEV